MIHEKKAISELDMAYKNLYHSHVSFLHTLYTACYLHHAATEFVMKCLGPRPKSTKTSRLLSNSALAREIIIIHCGLYSNVNFTGVDIPSIER